MSNPEELRQRLYPKFADGFFPDIACGAGWYGLIEELDRKITELDENYKICQIKQKYGSLRYYVEHSTDSIELIDQIEELTHAYEDKSLTVCEICGSAGKEGSIKGYEWAVRCSKCAPTGWMSHEEAKEKYDL